MDNKLSELSKPVAEVVSKFGDPEAFGERELKVLTDIQKLAYGTKFHSQEYVTALQQRSDRLDAMLTESAQALKAAEQRIAELEAKLATPVRLPRPSCTYADHSYPAYSRKQVEEILTSAGMCFTVEGDEQ